MLAHDFGNDGGAYALTEIAVYDNAGTIALGRNFLEKQKKFCSSYPKSAVWVGCFSQFRCTMSL